MMSLPLQRIGRDMRKRQASVSTTPNMCQTIQIGFLAQPLPFSYCHPAATRYFVSGLLLTLARVFPRRLEPTYLTTHLEERLYGIRTMSQMWLRHFDC